MHIDLTDTHVATIIYSLQHARDDLITEGYTGADASDALRLIYSLMTPSTYGLRLSTLNDCPSTATGFSPLAQWEAERKQDPMPRARGYSDPIVFARDYEAWLNRRGETMADRTVFDGPGEGERR